MKRGDEGERRGAIGVLKVDKAGRAGSQQGSRGPAAGPGGALSRGLPKS
jgi:hypothetical protein